MYRKLKVNNGVYTLTNTKNGKKYIGYSDNLAERIHYHFKYDVPHRDDYYLHKYIRKHGVKSNQKTFKLDILYSVDDYKDMDKLREVYLDYYLNNKEEYQYNVGVYKAMDQYPDEFVKEVLDYYKKYTHRKTKKHFNITADELDRIKGNYFKGINYNRVWHKAYYKVWSDKYKVMLEGSCNEVSEQIGKIIGKSTETVAGNLRQFSRIPRWHRYSFELIEYRPMHPKRPMV